MILEIRLRETLYESFNPLISSGYVINGLEAGGGCFSEPHSADIPTVKSNGDRKTWPK